MSSEELKGTQRAKRVVEHLIEHMLGLTIIYPEEIGNRDCVLPGRYCEVSVTGALSFTGGDR